MGDAGTRHLDNFDPVYELIHEEDVDTLVMYLPGFKKEELRVQLDGTGTLKIFGARPLGNSKFSSLRKIFTVPQNCDREKISARFEDGVLFVCQPKLSSTAGRDLDEGELPHTENQPPQKPEERMPAPPHKPEEQKLEPPHKPESQPRPKPEARIPTPANKPEERMPAPPHKYEEKMQEPFHKPKSEPPQKPEKRMQELPHKPEERTPTPFHKPEERMKIPPQSPPPQPPPPPLQSAPSPSTHPLPAKNVQEQEMAKKTEPGGSSDKIIGKEDLKTGDEKKDSLPKLEKNEDGNSGHKRTDSTDDDDNKTVTRPSKKRTKTPVMDSGILHKTSRKKAVDDIDYNRLGAGSSVEKVMRARRIMNTVLAGFLAFAFGIYVSKMLWHSKRP